MTLRARAAAVLLAAAALAGLAVSAASAAPPPVAAADSIAGGPVTLVRDGTLCLTANSADAGAIIHFNLCQEQAKKYQGWIIRWTRPRTNSKSGPAVFCLITHPKLCIGPGPFDKEHNRAPAELYQGTGNNPAPEARALTLYRSTGGWKIGADGLFGFRLTTAVPGRNGARFGVQAVFRKPFMADPVLFTLPRFHVVRSRG